MGVVQGGGGPCQWPAASSGLSVREGASQLALPLPPTRLQACTADGLTADRASGRGQAARRSLSPCRAGRDTRWDAALTGHWKSGERGKRRATAVAYRRTGQDTKCGPRHKGSRNALGRSAPQHDPKAEDVCLLGAALAQQHLGGRPASRCPNPLTHLFKRCSAAGPLATGVHA